jgi:hypothetical protein
MHDGLKEWHHETNSNSNCPKLAYCQIVTLHTACSHPCPDDPACHPEAANAALGEEGKGAMGEECAEDGTTPAVPAGRPEACRDVLFELGCKLQVGEEEEGGGANRW